MIVWAVQQWGPIQKSGFLSSILPRLVNEHVAFDPTMTSERTTTPDD